MGRYIGPKCKLERRMGEKLFLKGDHCAGPKCGVVRRNYPPGAHGQKGIRKLTSYGIQLREKQKAKLIFNIRERQMKSYYVHAKQKKGDTGHTLLQMLEQRLDNVVYRLGLAKSRTQARQIVCHRHILVNNRVNNAPSTHLGVGTMITIRQKSKASPLFQKVQDTIGRYVAPSWLKLNTEELSGQIINAPGPEDSKQNFDVKAIVEFYSR